MEFSKKTSQLILCGFIIILFISGCNSGQIADLATETPTNIATSTPTNTPTPTSTPEPTITPTPLPTETAIPEPTSTEILLDYDISDPNEDERSDAIEEYRRYCLSRRGKELDQYYIDENPFYTDISTNAQIELGIPVLVKPVCHFGMDNAPEAIVLHFTGSLGNHQSSVNHFRDPDLGISSHYVIDRDGTIVQLVPESYVAYHVSCFGNSDLYCLPDAPLAFDEYGNTSFPEERSIGIELSNAGPLVYLKAHPDSLSDKHGNLFDGEPFVYAEFSLTGQYKYEFWEPYTPEQLASLEILILDIFKRWGIDMLLGHNDIQQNIDPGPVLIDFIDQFQ